jgi:leucyl-tRNA synthetase
MVISDGRKMSKHLGNVVDPDELVERFGADTLRLAVLYAARPQRTLNWSESAVLRCHRFLTQLWDYCHVQLQAGTPLPAAAGAEPLLTGPAERGGATKDETEHLRLRLSKWCQSAVERTTEDMEQLEMHSAVRNVMRLFDRVRDFEKRVRARRGEPAIADRAALLAALSLLCELLAPMAPHIAEELWIALGNDAEGSAPWPGLSFQMAA